MPQKFLHYVSPELVGEAAYKNFANIESHALTSGSVIKFYPGTYEMGSQALDGVILEGEGSRESVILCNLVTTISNTVVFRNLTLSGNSPAAASTSRSIHINNASNAAAMAKFDQVVFTNGDFGVDNQGLSQLEFVYVDGRGVDRFLRSNSVVSANIMFSLLNTSSNAFFTGANATLKAVQVRHSFSGGSNTGNTVRTVTANVP
jgi:hypothetical protein